MDKELKKEQNKSTSKNISQQNPNFANSIEG